MLVATIAWAGPVLAEESFELDIGKLDMDVVEQVPAAQVRTVSAEELKERAEEADGTFLGLPRDSFVELTGILAGLFLFLAALSRWVRPHGRGLLMLRIHKTCAYIALACAAAHATLNLLF